MPAYVRPALPSLVFRDASGAVIDYGHRWDGSPPEDAYTVAQHPERWAPVVLVADALVAWLIEEYDVVVTHDPPPEDGPFSTALGLDVARRTRLTPARPDAAPLEFVHDDHPVVHIRAGLTRMSGFPGCGCDACDDSLGEVIEDLESFVLAVVAGRFREESRGSTFPGLVSAVRSAFELPDGTESESGEYPLNRVRRPDRRTLRRQLAHVRGGWQPWPLRHNPSGRFVG